MRSINLSMKHTGGLTCNQKAAYNHGEMSASSDSMDAAFKALADSSRRALLDILFQNNGQTLGELCTFLSMTRQATSKHLRILEDANIVTVVWQGREKLHYLNPVPLYEIAERWIGKFEQHPLHTLHKLKQTLEGNIE